ncbi:MAG: hypothetical protein J6D29_06305 [Solobacterium sp.]|nr:hypothetical protein [Solobacterium sp.]
MKRIILVVAILFLLFEGVGSWIAKKIKYDGLKLNAPIGFACILGLLQVLYYPILFFNLSFTWIVVVTSIVLGLALILTLLSLKDVFKHLTSKTMLFVFLSTCFFAFILSKCYVDLDYSDSSTYLNYIALNINAPQLNLYSLSNGLRGEEWNIYYQYQGYYHFCSYLCWLINIPYYLLGSNTEVPNLVITVWGMGLLYHLLTSALIVNLVLSFKDCKAFFRYSLLVFLLLYSNFFYWNIPLAFYGNTMRALFIMLAIYLIYSYDKEANDKILYLLIPTISSGLACSSTFLFMGFAIIYALAVYLFHQNISHSFHKLYAIILPFVLYVVMFLSRSHLALGLALGLIYLVILFLQNRKPMDALFSWFDAFLLKYGEKIFLIVVPVLFAIGSFIIHLTVKNDFTSYGYYFKDFSHSDMMSNYLLIPDKWLELFLNVFRWASVIVVLFFIKKEEVRWLRMLLITMLVFFLNPLCTILLMQTITGLVFYRNFMVVFNPITEGFLFYYLYQKLKQQPFQIGFACILACATILGNVGSFMEDEQTGIYWVYYKGGKNVDPIYKLDPDEYQATLFLKDEIRNASIDHQPVLITQSGGTLTFIPEAYQVFGPWQYYYELDRVDEDFYQVARKPEDWLDKTNPKYENTCLYLHGYQVDYVLLQYWASDEFDKYSDGCTVTLYEGSKYKVKKVVPQQ